MFAGILIGFGLLGPAPSLAFPSIALLVGAIEVLFAILLLIRWRQKRPA